MVSRSDLMRFLSGKPDATITEVAFRFGVSVQEARLLMSDLPDHDEWQTEPTLQAAIDADDAIEQHDAAWLAELFRSREVMDIYQAAEYLGINHGSVEAAISRGRLSCVQVGHKKLLARADLDAYLERRKTGEPVAGVVIEV